jgi:hypothetical protein
MDWDQIADSSAGSVLELLARDEPLTAEERAAAERGRAARVRRQLDALAGSLRDERWNGNTTGVELVRLLADLIDRSRECPEVLHAFVRETIDGKRNAFRPYRVSQYLKVRHGVGISNHTVQKMLGKLADVGRDGTGGDGAISASGRTVTRRTKRVGAARAAGSDGPMRPQPSASVSARRRGTPVNERTEQRRPLSHGAMRSPFRARSPRRR